MAAANYGDFLTTTFDHKRNTIGFINSVITAFLRMAS